MSEWRVFRKVMAAAGYTTVEPLPSAEELSRFYANVYFQQQASATYQDSYSEDELAQKRLRSAVTIHAIEKVLGRPSAGSRFIEVGCGEGFMLAEALRSGFNVMGLDYSSYGVQKFHPDLTAYVRQGDAMELIGEFLSSGDQAAVCVLQNVLEHVRDPRELMSSVHRLLDSRGLAVITVPNDYSRLQQRATELGLSDHEYWFVPPQHLNYFNVENLRAFASSTSFEVVDMFGDFPIEMFLFHRSSNYVLDRSQGKDAHRARVVLDLLLAEQGLEPYYQFCRALTACGMGRNVTLVLKPSASPLP